MVIIGICNCTCTFTYETCLNEIEIVFFYSMRDIETSIIDLIQRKKKIERKSDFIHVEADSIQSEVQKRKKYKMESFN